jgi:indole-3-glycerol phosphate synthase
MPNILREIIAHKRLEVDARMRSKPIELVRAIAEEMPSSRDFYSSLASDDLPRIIAECKRQSPSKGIMKADYRPIEIAADYETGGAAAISVLTDEKYFGGKLSDLSEVSETVSIPVLRKDFIIDEYQIYEARAAGADSFLLISGVLDFAQLQYFCEIGRDLGMEALVECHNIEEVDSALKTDCKILGINNRNLKDMKVSLNTAVELAGHILKHDSNRILVCESGIKSRDDIQRMQSVGYRAFLIGEALMLSPDPSQALMDLRR